MLDAAVCIAAASMDCMKQSIDAQYIPQQYKRCDVKQNITNDASVSVHIGYGYLRGVGVRVRVLVGVGVLVGGVY